MSTSNKRLLYFGTPSYSASLLSFLIKKGYNFVGVVTQPDKEVGRKKVLTPSPVKEVALEHSIPVFTPLRLRKEYDFINELNPDAIICFSYGQIIPQEVLDIPAIGCLNVHGSILPKYRGASPLQAVLIHREKETGVTLMEMTRGMDEGPIYDSLSFPIPEDINYTDLIPLLVEAAKSILDKDLDDYLDGKLVSTEQDPLEATYCYPIKKEEEKLDLSKPSEELLGYIHGLSEEPGGYFLLSDEKLKAYNARRYSYDKKGEVGALTPSKDGLILECTDGEILLTDIQLEGKKRMKATDFINGHPHIKGEKLS
ncbi:MAG: methionyl-tRNA formyltransferase [Coprobacillus sp.]|nr:methionyl-tRNA formyltransferase [Coprobacillus sp.]